MRIAPDSKTLTGFPLGPSGSTIAGNLAVRTDFQEFGVELLALADIDDLDGVGKRHFLQRNADLAAVWRVERVQFNGHRASPCIVDCVTCTSPTRRWCRGGRQCSIACGCRRRNAFGQDRGEDYGIADLHVRADRRRRPGTERVAHAAAQERGSRRRDRRAGHRKARAAVRRNGRPRLRLRRSGRGASAAAVRRHRTRARCAGRGHLQRQRAHARALRPTRPGRGSTRIAGHRVRRISGRAASRRAGCCRRDTARFCLPAHRRA